MEIGGKTLYGATLGILMLETHFPRVPGDVGNATTFSFPVQYRVVKGASPEKVVCDNPLALTDRFIEAGRDLVAMGCDGIATTCGFLAPLQKELADALSVPVATSSLMQIPLIRSILPGNLSVGVITISVENLSKDHLNASGVADPETIPLVGLKAEGAFASAILQDRRELDIEASRAEMLAAAEELTKQHRKLGAIVLECTNMAPYAAELRRMTGLPVYSVVSFLNWFQSGLMPQKFNSGLEDPRG